MAIMNRIVGLIGLLVLVISASIGTGAPVSARQADCPGAPAPRLTVGGQGRVTPGLPNNLRSGAGIWTTRIGLIPGGATFQVLAGPVCAGYYNWWQVNYQGLIGWTAEGIFSTYWLEPWGGTGPTSVLSLRVDPVVRQDGDFIVLTPNTYATIMLSSTPPDASSVLFYLTPDGPSDTAHLIGTDTDLRDGAIIQWTVPAAVRGYLSASVYDALGRVIQGSDRLGVVAYGTPLPPSETPPSTAGTFTHSTLGFQIDVPAGWVAQEDGAGVLISQPLNKLQLLITQSPPSGLPAGDRITFTDIPTALGIDLRRDNLVYQGRTKAAIYQYQGLDQIPVGGYHLYIMFMDISADYNAIDLSDSLLISVDQIVATLRRP
jgi:hypothetical protein